MTREVEERAEEVKEGVRLVKEETREVEGPMRSRSGPGRLRRGPGRPRRGAREVKEGANEVEEGAREVKEGAREAKEGARCKIRKIEILLKIPLILFDHKFFYATLYTTPLKDFKEKDRNCLTLKYCYCYCFVLYRGPTSIIFLWLPLKYPIIYSFQIKVENHVTKFYL